MSSFDSNRVITAERRRARRSTVLIPSTRRLARRKHDEEKEETMMEASRLARLAYGALVEQAHKLQLEIVQQELVNARFGIDALPVNQVTRWGSGPMLDGRATRVFDGETKRRLDEYIDAIREFDSLFEIEMKESAEAFARAMAERMRAGK